MLDKLTFLIALARERHFRLAAEQCGVTQPTLSAGIKSLEDILGVALVNRGSRYIGLTPEGERVLDWARRLTGDAQAMRQDLAAMKRGIAGEIRLAAIPTALPVAAQLCETIAARHPDVRFSVQSASSKAILAMMEDFAIEGAITYLDNEPLPNVAVTPMYDEGYCLVTAADGPFAGRDTVKWSELRGLNLCLFTTDMQNRRIVQQLLTEHVDQLGDFTQTNSSLVMATLVSSGRWSSIMPPVLVEATITSPRVISIPVIAPQVHHSVGLIVSEREPMTGLVRALVEAAAGWRFDR